MGKLYTTYIIQYLLRECEIKNIIEKAKIDFEKEINSFSTFSTN